MFGFLKKAPHYEPGTLVFDYYDGQAGLPIQPGYTEYTITTTEDTDKMQLDFYSRPGGDDAVESRTSYLVSATVLDDVMKLVKKHRLARWNKRNYPSIDGRKMVCKFMWNGELVRVSSENMPVDGKSILGNIRSVLYGYAEPALILEKSDENE